MSIVIPTKEILINENVSEEIIPDQEIAKKTIENHTIPGKTLPAHTRFPNKNHLVHDIGNNKKIKIIIEIDGIKSELCEYDTPVIDDPTLLRGDIVVNFRYLQRKVSIENE